VHGWLDCRFAERNDRPAVEFSWEGEDEGDQRCGRGWAMLMADGKLEGRLFFHMGDDSAFSAVRTQAKKRAQDGAGGAADQRAMSLTAQLGSLEE
jgi:hypothetical protein